MSKHTTSPEPWNRGIGNINKHKQRRIPSCIRTPGRLARHAYRVLSSTDSPVQVPTHPVYRARFERNKEKANVLFNRRPADWLADFGQEDMGRDGWKAEGGAP